MLGRTQWSVPLIVNSLLMISNCLVTFNIIGIAIDTNKTYLSIWNLYCLCVSFVPYV
jgi:hypothetical protein